MRQRDRLAARLRVELAQHAGNVMIHGPAGEERAARRSRRSAAPRPSGPGLRALWPSIRPDSFSSRFAARAGMRRSPLSRRRRATICAAGRGLERTELLECPSLERSRLPRRARAPPRRDGRALRHTVAASRHRPSISCVCGSGSCLGRSSSIPARRRMTASSPSAHGARTRQGELECGVRFRRDVSASTRQPCCLAARGGDRAQFARARRWAPRDRAPRRATPRRPGRRVVLARVRARPAPGYAGKVETRRLPSTNSANSAACFPLPLVELEARSVGDEVHMRELVSAFAAERRLPPR